VEPLVLTNTQDLAQIVSRKWLHSSGVELFTLNKQTSASFQVKMDI
jgi:hypothetical protein